MPRIYIAYRLSDGFSTAERIRSQCIEAFGKSSVFAGTGQVHAMGMRRREFLKQMIGSCDVVLVLVGPQFMSRQENGRLEIASYDDVMRLEIETALRSHARIIPVLIKGASMPPRDALPEAIQPLTTMQAVVLRQDQLESDIALLLAGLFSNPKAYVSLFRRVGRFRLLARVAIVVALFAFAGFKAYELNFIPRPDRLPRDIALAAITYENSDQLEVLMTLDGDYNSVTFNPPHDNYGASGYVLAMGSEAAGVLIYSLNDNRPGVTLEKDKRMRVLDLDFHPARELLAVAYYVPDNLSYETHIWWWNEGISATRSVDVYSVILNGLDFDSTGNLLVIPTHSPRIWDLEQRSLESLSDPTGLMDDAAVFSTEFHPRDPILAMGLETGKVLLWDVEANSLLYTLEDCEDCPVGDVGFHPSRELLYSLDSVNGVITWDLETGQKLGQHPNEGLSPALNLTIHPRGQFLAYTSNGQLIFIQMDEGILGENRTLSTGALYYVDMAINDAATLIATVNNRGTVELWGIPAN